jgi:hypothetical protein
MPNDTVRATNGRRNGPNRKITKGRKIRIRKEKITTKNPPPNEKPAVTSIMWTCS